MDSFLLARMQFALNISFHILFPTISISLGWFLLYLKFKFSKTNNYQWMQIYKLWVKIFALTFAVGTVSGITMSFQFGTNWPGFMQKVGNVAGPLLSYEVLTAFFLEATFLGIMLFGEKKVSNKIHTLSTFLVAFGTTLSAFWILALNSWMHTPAGYEIINDKVFVTSWIQVIFNPSFPFRFLHMLTASALTMSFLVSGVSSFQWIKGDKSSSLITNIKISSFLAAFLIPCQIILGDLHGLNTLHYQPAKLSSMEGIWTTQNGAPAVIFAIPDEQQKTNLLEISIPKLASIYLTHHPDGKVPGLDQFIDNHPPVKPVFFSFRIMVGTALLMLASSWFISFKFLKNKIFNSFDAKILISMTFSGWIAVISGWYVTEIGRQPWLVTGILKTSEAVSKTPPNILFSSFVTYLILYIFVLISYIYTIFYLAKKQSIINNEAHHD